MAGHIASFQEFTSGEGAAPLLLPVDHGDRRRGLSSVGAGATHIIVRTLLRAHRDERRQVLAACLRRHGLRHHRQPRAS
jgi:hypothetical protein